MSVTTTRACDRCKDEVTGDDQLWEVGILATCIYPGNSHSIFPKPQQHRSKMYSLAKNHKMEVCRSCLIHIGLIPGAEEEEPPVVPPTLEDLLREIVEETIEGAMEDRY